MIPPDPRLIVRDYLKARRSFLEAAHALPDLKGNDNVIGRVGEFIALEYLRSKGGKPEKHQCSSNPGYDITDGLRRISVKTITAENTTGRTVRLNHPWDDFMFIVLDTDYEVEAIGTLTHEQFLKARLENKKWSEFPYVKKTMVSKGGLIGRYGCVDTTYRLKL